MRLPLGPWRRVKQLPKYQCPAWGQRPGDNGRVFWNTCPEHEQCRVYITVKVNGLVRSVVHVRQGGNV